MLPNHFHLIIQKLIITFLLFVACSTASAVSFKALTDLNQDYRQLVNRQLTQYGIPGGAYAIIKDNQIVAIETFGYLDNANKQAVNPQTVFRLASVSKPFAATAAVMLAHEQRLTLTDPITRYVPNFALKPNGAADKILLKHILSHTSGLMPNAYDNLLHENWDMGKIIGRFNRVTPICQPESCYGYQNITYGLLQNAIEASQPLSYGQLLTSKIFAPLAMKNASVGYQAFIEHSNTAKPHVLIKRVNTGKRDSAGKAIKRYVWRTVDVEPDFYKVPAAAGVNASITDLAKWLMANLGYAPEVLSPALLAELTTPRVKTQKDLRRKHWRKYLTDAHYGYGWRIYQFDDMPIVYHSGWVEGYRADIGYAPELGVGFALLINAESNVVNKLSSQFWANTYQLSQAPDKS
ncbi:serine hydrolase domain-containing protein [Colwellia sp. MEBiC06753]